MYHLIGVHKRHLELWETIEMGAAHAQFVHMYESAQNIIKMNIISTVHISIQPQPRYNTRNIVSNSLNLHAFACNIHEIWWYCEIFRRNILIVDLTNRFLHFQQIFTTWKLHFRVVFVIFGINRFDIFNFPYLVELNDAILIEISNFSRSQHHFSMNFLKEEPKKMLIFVR